MPGTVVVEERVVLAQELRPSLRRLKRNRHLCGRMALHELASAVRGIVAQVEHVGCHLAGNKTRNLHVTRMFFGLNQNGSVTTLVERVLGYVTT